MAADGGEKRKKSLPRLLFRTQNVSCGLGHIICLESPIRILKADVVPYFISPPSNPYTFCYG